MEMFLMILCLSVLATGVLSLAFAAATRDVRSQPPIEREPLHPPASPRFFAEPAVPPVTKAPQIPIEALLLQIENHVRLEQAAAESFVESPTADLLHSRTISPLVQ